MEVVYASVGKRTKRAVSRASLLEVGWDDEQTVAFDKSKAAIVNRTTLSHRDPGRRPCIYTDASDTHWSGILTQVKLAKIKREHAQQDHEPLAFHYGGFNATELS